MKKPKGLIQFTNDRPGHDFRYSLDSSKISSNLGWKPSHSFEEGLKHTIEWYLENKKWRKNIPSKEIKTISWKTR
ncbi:GDP-mannose 4,6-dehydratase [Candidatus Nitrosotenuis chungbukensis]|nr:GDP-mannose 4,6-dehydratase [Candidatus Nitrosotenuis chungbukensis]